MSVLDPDDEDVVKEMRDVHVPRVDAVDGPAHHRPFLILKAGAVDPMAILDRVLKATYDTARQRAMLARGHAMKGPDGQPAYPIGDTADLDNAIHAVGRGDADHDKIRRFIAHRAEQLGATGSIPTDWAPDGSLRESVTKAMDDDLEGLGDGIVEPGDVEEAAAGIIAPTHEGDPDDVASPAWEAVDAARARAAVGQVTALKGLVAQMLDRETTEAVSGDPADEGSAMDLDAVLDALDCALGVLAKFAATEQAEADDRAQEIADQAEALGIVKAIGAATEQVVKAGRVLSTANETSLRAAHAALTEVLGRLPAPDSEEAAMTAPEPVEKAADAMPEPVEKADSEAPDEPIEKAGVTPDDLRNMLRKLAAGVPDAKVAEAVQSLMAYATAGDAPATEDKPADAPTDAPAPTEASEPAPVEAALTAPPAPPAPDATTGVLEPPAPAPDEPVTKATTQTDTILDAVARALAGIEDRVTKALEPLTDHAEKLEKRLAIVEATPVPGGPLLNGAAPTTQSSEPGDILSTVRKTIADITDPELRRTAQGTAVHELLMGMQRGSIPTTPARR